MPASQDQIDSLLADAEELAAEAERQLGTVADAAPRTAGSLERSAPDAKRTQRIMQIEVPVIVNLAERAMRVGDVVRLSSGSIIEFDKPADAELNLMVNNKCVGCGTAVKVGENFGLRIKSVGTREERLGALSDSIKES